MNQREAAVTLIEFVREQAPEDKRVLRALKVMEKRADVLRHRWERQHSSISDDIMEEPLTVTFEQFLSIFRGEVCVACRRPKAASFAFCIECFRKLDGPTCKAFSTARTIHFGFCRALRFFDRHPVQGEGGMLYWPQA